ncbi:dienelactone hydrolase family protein [Colletotrichum tofieldiae]|nr:dienelactone hydrolase family protein [Colletotrichum tofieldiae]
MTGYALPESLLALTDRLQGEKSWFWKYFVIAPVAAAKIVRHFVPFLVATRSGVVVPRIGNFLRAVRLAPPAPLAQPSASSSASVDSASAAQKTTKIGVAGFCWGGKYTVQLTQLGAGPFGPQPLVDCGHTAHPSFLSLPGTWRRRCCR